MYTCIFIYVGLYMLYILATGKYCKTMCTHVYRHVCVYMYMCIPGTEGISKKSTTKADKRIRVKCFYRGIMKVRNLVCSKQKHIDGNKSGKNKFGFRVATKLRQAREHSWRWLEFMW